MPGRHTHHCSQRQTTEALARDALVADQCYAAQSHLEECETCRTLFRQLTAEHFPRFPNYTIIERIGEGGFGVVYKVIHHAKERTEALKVLFGKTPIRQAYFQNEVHLIAKLQHPHIATLYEAHLSNPPLYYTMEFVEGEQLDSYFRSRQVPLADRINVVKSVAQAVGYAHQQGVVHRDIKPQNILIDGHGQPRIVDFGIAKKLGLADEDDDGHPRSPEGVLGTFGYIAPEQVAGEPVDARADVFALGALLYHSVTGEPAKFAGQPDRLAQSLHARQVTRAEDLAAIVTRCVDPLPERRYGSCAAFIEDVDNYLSGRPVRARQDRSRVYRVTHVAAFALRTRPLAVRVFIVTAVAALLAFLSWRAEARWSVPGVDAYSTALVVFTADTNRAIARGEIGADLDGLDADNVKSWRLLRGRLMQRLAAARPRVVVWDSYFNTCEPQFDDELVGGFEALRAADVPVVIGVKNFDLNSEPQTCPRILAAVHNYGTLASTEPITRANEWVVPICVQRGVAKPVPGLAVAAFAAARHPDASLDIEVERHAVALRYRERSVQSGGALWYVDRIRFQTADRIQRDTLNGMLQAGDLVFQMHVKASSDQAAGVPQTSLREVLQADPEQLRNWFGGRIVVLGSEDARDRYPTVGGGMVHGYQIQAGTIQSLSKSRLRPFERRPLVVTILLWCALAALLTGLVPRGRRLALRWTVWICCLGSALGVLLVLIAAWRVTDFWQLQVALAVGSLLAAGCPAYLARAVRERQMQLAPELKWSSEDDTIASTLLATANDGEDDGAEANAVG